MMERLAEWDWATGAVVLEGTGLEYEYAFNKLMGLAHG